MRNTENKGLTWISSGDGPEFLIPPPGAQIYPMTSSQIRPGITVQIIGSGFIVGVPGIFGNTTIPATPEADHAADPDTSSLITEQSPDPTPRQAAKPKAAKHPQEH